MSTFRKRQKIIERDGDFCHYCKLPFEAEGLLSITLDHIAPVSKGGGDGVDNLVVAHKRCNSWKGRQSYEGFMKKVPMLLGNLGIPKPDLSVDEHKERVLQSFRETKKRKVMHEGQPYDWLY